MAIRILNVGQCGYDGGQIEALLSRVFGATVDHSPSQTDAQRRCAQGHYDLILVNRLLDADRSSGLELIRDLLDGGTSIPIMLVSNLPTAQESAVKLGAIRGFGKAELNTPETVARLQSVLDRKPGAAEVKAD
jgi:DNA-binding response OmpR family regulator